MSGKYCAILSIHGIGRHRHYANTGALLSALETIARDEQTETIIQVKAGAEPARNTDLNSDVPFLRLRRGVRQPYGALKVGREFRIYEVNWSPDTKQPLSILDMLAWTGTLLASALRLEPRSWLDWPRLRLARLRYAYESSPRGAHPYTILASAYRTYRGSLGTQHRKAEGKDPNFSDFVTFARKRAGTSSQRPALEESARIWRNSRLPCEASTRKAGGIALGGFLLAALAVTSLVTTLWGNADVGTASRIVLLVLLLLTVVGLWIAGQFLTTIFSDVRYWSALNENDRHHEARDAVLDRAIATIRHLVADPACTRVTIVSHSLGTAIAYDALRAIGLHNLARKGATADQIQIRKVSCLITMGSPIDKLAYLFETSGGGSFREELMREELRGDTTTLPFWVKRKQRIEWLNFWDPADAVSDPIFGPLGAKPLGDRFEATAIENIAVANTRFFDPIGSHIRYLMNPAVAGRIFNEIFSSSEAATFTGETHQRTRAWSRRLMHFSMIGLCVLLAAFSLVQVVRWN